MVVIFVVVIVFGVVRVAVVIFVVVKVWELREVSRCDSRCHLVPLPMMGSLYKPFLLSLLLLLFVLSYCCQSVGFEGGAA